MMRQKSKSSSGSSIFLFSREKPRGKSDVEVIQIGGWFFSRILFLRIVVTTFLVVTTVLVSVYTYLTLVYLEQQLYESQYESFSGQALQTAERTARHTSEGAKAMAFLMGESFPDASQWPFVARKHYAEASAKVGAIYDRAGDTFFMPRVQPAQLSEFNAFMNSYYESETRIPPRAGEYAVTKMSIDAITGLEEPALEETGETLWGSPFNDIFPILQIAEYSNLHSLQSLGFNMHSALPYGYAIDTVLSCALEASPEDLEADAVLCGAISDTISEHSSIPNPSNNVFIQPIYPTNNRTTMVGAVMIGLNWADVLSNIVPSTVTGLDFVVESPKSTAPAMTFRIEYGKLEFAGEGDLHDPIYDKFSRSRSLSLSDSISPTSNIFTITMYPRKEFIKSYTTHSPRNSTITVVMVAFITSMAFLIYDHFMKRDSSEKEDLLQTKRQFVRFISHEVRTPLNAVAMGLALLENEFQQAMEDLPGSLSTQEMNTVACRDETEKQQLVVRGVGDGRGAADRSEQVNKSLTTKFNAQIEDWRQLTVDITENANSAVFVLDDLLNYDKIETGSLRLELKEVDIWELARKTVHTFDLAAKQAKVNLTLHVEREFDIHLNSKTPEDMVRQSTIESIPHAVSTASLLEGGATHRLSIVPETLIVCENIKERDEKESVEEDLEAGLNSRHALQPHSSVRKSLSALQLAYSKASGEMRVMGDGTRLAQVIHNLISNAPKFTPEEGSVTVIAKWTAEGVPKGAPREELSKAFDIAHPRAGSIRISVTDTGAGLNEEQLANICSEGVQFNANTLQGGRGGGLGLFISKGIVEQHGGAMVVTSEGLGHGTTFTVELPLYLFPRSDADEITEEAENYLSAEEEDNNESDMTTEFDLPRSFSDVRAIGRGKQAKRRELSLKEIRGIAHDNPNSTNLRAFSQSFVARDQQEEEENGLMTTTKTKTTTQAAVKMEKSNHDASPSVFPRNVLVVDDAASNRKMLMRLLQGKGCVCTEARNGLEALEIFQKTTLHFRNRDLSRSLHSSSRVGTHSSSQRSVSFGKAFLQTSGSATFPPKKDNPMAPAKVATADNGCKVVSGTVAVANGSSSDSVEASSPSLEDFDAIFMDFEMPILNGPDATKLIRELGCRCLIVGITGNVLPADVRHFLGQGADAVLPKPLQLASVTRLWQEHASKNNLLPTPKSKRNNRK